MNKETTLMKTTAISPQVMLAWNRIPFQNKQEIIAAVEHEDASDKVVKIGKQTLNVRNFSSGFCVVYEPGETHNTIVSVLTPREAKLAGE